MSFASLLTWLQGLKSLGLDSRMRRLLANRACTSTRLVVLLQRAKAIILPAGCRQLFLLHCTQMMPAFMLDASMHIRTQIAVRCSSAYPWHPQQQLCIVALQSSVHSVVGVLKATDWKESAAHLQTSDTQS